MNPRLGLAAVYLEDGEGHTLTIPYRIPAHGIILTSASAGITLLAIPISAIEDPRFLRWLGQRGVYRIEDVGGSIARIGEGRVIDRLRRHRSHPILIPGVVTAAFATKEEWSYITRRALEARLAASWVAEGNCLASRTFNWQILNDYPEMLRTVSQLHCDLEELCYLSERILDHDADQFVAVDAIMKSEAVNQAPVRITAIGPVARLNQTRHALHARIFPSGCRIRFEDGLVAAHASVHRDGVTLLPGSTVYRSVGPQAGRNFRRRHIDFLAQAGVSDEGEIGTTAVAVVADSAAFLLKSITGGRIHMASRWQITSTGTDHA